MKNCECERPVTRGAFNRRCITCGLLVKMTPLKVRAGLVDIRIKIKEEGRETRSGRITFPKKLREKYRKITEDYISPEYVIKSRMIHIYNEDKERDEVKHD